MSVRSSLLGGTALAAVSLFALIPLNAGATGLYYDRAVFLGDPGVGATSAINFDSDATGTDLTGKTVSGVTFQAPGSSPLLVIAGSAGVRNSMSPSSGLNVLSPGGSNTALENDDLELVFAAPVQAAGLDVVYDAPDGASFVGVTFYDATGAVLASNGFLPAPIGAPGYQFVGFVSASANIKRIVFDEFDGSPPDDHVAYDSVVFSPAVPEPGTYALMFAGLGWVGFIACRRQRG
jgi:hypothetical protein